CGRSAGTRKGRKPSREAWQQGTSAPLCAKRAMRVKEKMVSDTVSPGRREMVSDTDFSRLGADRAGDDLLECDQPIEIGAETVPRERRVEQVLLLVQGHVVQQHHVDEQIDVVRARGAGAGHVAVRREVADLLMLKAVESARPVEERRGPAGVI